MKKYIFSSILLLSAAVAAAQPADWSRFFQPWESGCAVDVAGAPLTRFNETLSFIVADGQGGFRLQADFALPEAYRSQAEPTVTFHKVPIGTGASYYVFDQVRVALRGTYYGLPLEHYSKTFLLETAGIEYHRLLLNVPFHQAQRVLAGKYRARTQYNPVLEAPETLQAQLRPVNIRGQEKTLVECMLVYG